ncbi:MAG: sensor histidine kinase [Frankia sp.]
MTTRARELLDRSRALLGNPRDAAAQFFGLSQPRSAPEGSIPKAHAAPVPSTSEEALSAICAGLALRDLNLVDSLLSQLEAMEAREQDTDRLAELYHLDHLAARLRRNAENLRILAGRDAGETTAGTSSLVDVIRAAMSSIDHYPRVTIGQVVSLGVVGFAAEDVSRLLAELLDNATKSSPPNVPVRVGVHLTEQGSALLRVEDEGIGLPPDRMRQLNQQLSGDPVLDDETVRHMGLAVVRRLAVQHHMRTWLDRRHPHGTTASVVLPASLLCELPEASWSGTHTVVFPHAENSAPARREPPKQRAAGGTLKRGPKTDAASPRQSPQLRPVVEPAIAGTTVSGLPRRMPRSLKGHNGQDAAPPLPETSAGAGNAKLLADLGAFAEGERAARGEQRGA